MTALLDITGFTTHQVAGADRAGADLTLVVAAATYRLPTAGRSPSDGLVLADEQPGSTLQDSHHGDPASSSLRHEGQATTYTRPGTDIHVVGRAWGARGVPTPAALVRVQVGPCRREVAVIGERRWHGMLTLSASDPKPFESMPLVYERAFGGTVLADDGRMLAQEPRNPVGTGLYRSARDAKDQPLPNLEDPKDLIRSWSHRPAPAGLGPIARHWEPRRKFAGTYDAKWVDERAPLWPDDLDLRFFNAASPGLTATPKLQGGEPCVIEGCSPDGGYAFELPRVRIGVRFDLARGSERKLAELDAVIVDTEARTLTMVWRAHVLTKPFDHRGTVVRELRAWENAP